LVYFIPKIKYTLVNRFFAYTHLSVATLGA
jgi:hypothetical protein